jgi:hypothetical protein
MTEDGRVETISTEMIDAGAEALRGRLQGGKMLRDWRQLPNSSKKKWRDYAAVVLTAASTASSKKLER